MGVVLLNGVQYNNAQKQCRPETWTRTKETVNVLPVLGPLHANVAGMLVLGVAGNQLCVDLRFALGSSRSFSKSVSWVFHFESFGRSPGASMIRSIGMHQTKHGRLSAQGVLGLYI